MIISIILLGGLGFLIYKLISKWYTGNQMISDEKMYQQRGITVLYDAGTIQISKFSYPVDKITSVTNITETYGNRSTRYIKIDVDDMVKPVHKIGVIGSAHNADEFHQRICVALRKAGANGFI